ncbi:MAG: tRNA (adenosine(37)-N6)-threonylcarbamoyltransferase complex dimerization subunit type 1 TsaB [Candidatus Dadabacteria bacterium]|nr:MAG: tRNA (adenosine(37)-N6)-threonylcarbamoyltransferase complex dimerization subunit type 1 TsaB [Candidatus Dadabacteria bacterium]
MNILAIDTSTSRASVALKTNAGELHTASGSGINSHNEELALLVESLLEQAKLKASHLDKILIGSGPGSFTGLRIGFAFAKGLALSCSSALKSVCSFKAAAAAGRSCVAGGVLVIADARREEVFCAAMRIDADAISMLRSPEIISKVRIVDYAEDLGIYNRAESEKLSVILLSEISLPPNCQAVAYGNFNLAEGMIFIDLLGGEEADKFNTAEWLYSLKPNYVREVAARTIAERSAGKHSNAPVL